MGRTMCIEFKLQALISAADVVVCETLPLVQQCRYPSESKEFLDKKISLCSQPRVDTDDFSVRWLNADVPIQHLDGPTSMMLLPEAYWVRV